jgi:protein PET100
MGNWQLEIFKLSLWVTFPVGMFYVYNQAQFFENWVIKMKREMYPPEALSHHQELTSFIKSYRAEKESEFIKELQQEELVYVPIPKSRVK